MVYQKDLVRNATISIGNELVSGVYILKVSSSTETKTMKLVRVE